MPSITKEEYAQLQAKATYPVTEGWKNGVLTVFVPGKPMNPQDGKLRHPLKKAKTVAAWRDRTGSRIYAQRIPGLPWWTPAAPKKITFTVYSRQAFDDDNLSAVCKPVRDALKDMLIIVDDAPRHGHAFKYTNVVAPRQADVHGIAIRIELAR